MSRRLRHFLPDTSVHVIHRGIDHLSIFRDDEDHECFLAILRNVVRPHCLFVHGFALMNTHFHALLTPGAPQSLPRGLQSLSARYVRYFNRKYKRMGTIWNSRYRGILVTDEDYWLKCLRYIEQNPVRAGIVDRPEEFRWSSYRANGLGESISWLKPHPIYLSLGATAPEQQTAWREICDAQLTDEELAQQRLDASGCSQP